MCARARLLVIAALALLIMAPQALGQTVTGLTLINADTGAPLGPLGTKVNIAELPTLNLSIRAEVAGSVGSVVFDWDGTLRFRVENSAPYALGGDSGGKFAPVPMSLGDHTVKATAFSGGSGNGANLGSRTQAFSVVNEQTPPVFETFTPAEEAQLMVLVGAMNDLTGILMEYGAGVASAYTTEVNRHKVGQGLMDTGTAVDQLNKGLSGFLGVITEFFNTPPFAELAAKSRPDQVAHAMNYLDTTLVYIDRATASWKAAQTQNPDPTYQDWVNRVLVPLSAARAKVAGFDRGLGYLNFYPHAPSPNGTHTIIGPHGDYDAAMWPLWRSVVYFQRVVTDLAQAIRDGFPNGNYANSGRPLMAMGQATRNSIRAQAIFAAVEPTDIDRFFHVLHGLKALTDDKHPGTPINLHFGMAEIVGTYGTQMGRNPAFDALVRDAIVFTNDAWKHSDGGAWQSMVFPDCSILRNPNGCGGL